MRHQYRRKQIGSAWNFIFGLGAWLVFLFAFPLLALNSEAIDNWTSDINNQVKIVTVVVISGLLIAAVHLYNKLRRAE